MGVNMLTSQLAIAASKATSMLGHEAREAFAEIRKSAPEFLDQVEAVSMRAAGFMAAGMAGSIPIDVAKEYTTQETITLAFLAEKAIEAAAKQAILRSQRIIQITAEAGLEFAKIANRKPVADQKENES